MNEQQKNASLRLSILYDLTWCRHNITYEYFMLAIRYGLKLDPHMALKVYHLELQPRLIELMERFFIFPVQLYLPRSKGWVVRLTKRGREYLERHDETAEPLWYTAEQTLGRYRGQFHFLDLVDEEPSLPISSVPEPATTPLEQLVQEAEEDFDPAQVVDAKRRIWAQVVQRQGQDEFRQRLLSVYGERCAITGCDAPAALEAAHIVPYQGEGSNALTNGLLLRADLHDLFDAGLIVIEPATLRISLAPALQNTVYRELEGITLREPQTNGYRISRKALEFHRQWAKQVVWGQQGT